MQYLAARKYRVVALMTIMLCNNIHMHAENKVWDDFVRALVVAGAFGAVGSLVLWQDYYARQPSDREWELQKLETEVRHKQLELDMEITKNAGIVEQRKSYEDRTKYVLVVSQVQAGKKVFEGYRERVEYAQRNLDECKKENPHNPNACKLWNELHTAALKSAVAAERKQPETYEISENN